MRIRWVRGSERISFNRPHVWFCLGVRGSGKSSFLEKIACYYLDKGHGILDLFASRDSENLAWLRSPYAKDKKFLLVHGETVDVVESPCDTKPAAKVVLSDFEKYDFVISSAALYLNPDDEFLNAARLTDKIYKRLSWKKLIFMMIREASNLYYSRLKLVENQIFAKSQMIYLIREGRHCGLALGLDTLRFYSVDIDIRSLSDYIILKSQGMMGLTKDLKWVYRFFHDYVIRDMPPQYFFILSRRGAVGQGMFKQIPWHKREKENILKAVGIECKYGEPIEEAQYRGTYRTVGDKEHAEMIKLYIEAGLSVDRIAERLKRSSRTSWKHVKHHNSMIEKTGSCPACRRVKSKYEREIARRG